MEYRYSEELYSLVNTDPNTAHPTVFFGKMCHNIGKPVIIRLLSNMSATGGRRRNHNDSIGKDPDDDVRSAYEKQIFL